jgi:hypothetical protein
MTRPLTALLAALCATLTPLKGDRLPTELSTREFSYLEPRLSPDGQYIGFITGIGEQQSHHVLVLMNLTDRSTKVYQAPEYVANKAKNEEVTSFAWLTSERLIFTDGPADPIYDVMAPNSNDTGELLFSRGKKKLVGIRYPTVMYKTVWLDPDMAQRIP